MAKKKIIITMYMSELVYDIQNKTYLTGRSRNDGKNHEEVANMQANDDDENLSQVVRSIGNAFAMLKTKLAEFIDDTQETGNNVLLEPNTNLQVRLNMPCNYNSGTADTVSSSMHQYIVNMAVSDWFRITNKQDSNDYLAMAGNNIIEIREAINKRTRPARKKTQDCNPENEILRFE